MPDEVKLKLTYLDQTIKPVCITSGTASSSTRLTPHPQPTLGKSPLPLPLGVPPFGVLLPAP